MALPAVPALLKRLRMSGRTAVIGIPYAWLLVFFLLPWLDRIFHKPVEYLGCTRQYAKSNWKLYYENVKDPYHASLLHLFHTTFNIYRSNMRGRSVMDDGLGVHSIITTTPMIVSTDVSSWLSDCCRLWATLSMSLVTRLSRSPRACWST